MSLAPHGLLWTLSSQLKPHTADHHAPALAASLGAYPGTAIQQRRRLPCCRTRGDLHSRRQARHHDPQLQQHRTPAGAGHLGGLAYGAALVTNAAGPRSRWRRARFSLAMALASWSRPKKSSRKTTADASSPDPLWRMYRDWSLASAERRRVYLHASRLAGVIAAGLIALLAIVAIIAGTVSPAATEVVVVHHGRVSCGPVHQSRTFTEVTQVMTVNNC